MAGQFDHLVGDLLPGQTGWLPLDVDGNPTGPATVVPPPPPALACAVMRNPEQPPSEGQDELLTASGAPLETPLTPNTDPRDEDSYVPPVVPTISLLSPNTAECGDPVNIEMIVTGTGFTPNSVITFNGLDEPTDFYDSTSVGTGVKPSLFVVPATCPVAVRDQAGTSNSLDFTFTEPVEADVERFKRGHEFRNK